MCAGGDAHSGANMSLPVALSSSPNSLLPPDPLWGAWKSLLFKFTKIRRQKSEPWKCGRAQGGTALSPHCHPPPALVPEPVSVASVPPGSVPPFLQLGARTALQDLACPESVVVEAGLRPAAGLHGPEAGISIAGGSRGPLLQRPSSLLTPRSCASSPGGARVLTFLSWLLPSCRAFLQWWEAGWERSDGWSLPPSL